MTSDPGHLPALPGAPAGRRRAARLVVGGLAVVVAAGMIVVLVRAQRVTPFLPAAKRGCGAAGALVPVGGRLPVGCEVEALSSGSPRTLAEYAGGKPMVINFWASWCESCIAEMPDLQKVYAASRGQVQFLGLDLLGVDGEVRSQASAFATRRAVTYPLAYDDQALLYRRLSLRFLPPTTAFVRPDGTLAGIHIGQMDQATLRSEIKQDLGVEVPA